MYRKLNNYQINTILAVATSKNNHLMELLMMTKIYETIRNERRR